MCIEILDEFINKQDFLRSILAQHMKEKNPLELPEKTSSFDGDIKMELCDIGPYVIQFSPPNDNVLYELSEETENGTKNQTSTDNSAGQDVLKDQLVEVDTPAELGQEEEHEKDVTGEISELEKETAK